MRRFRFLAVTLSFLLIAAHPVVADDLSISKPLWISTGPSNSLDTAPSLFSFKNGVVSTSSEETNIHSHYKHPSFRRLRNYVYEGEMQIADADGGIGVTFHSQYRNSDTYYRLRYFPGDPTFKIAPHLDGIQVMTEGDIDSGVTPNPGKWYRFKVMVRTTASKTNVRAKVWRSNAQEPSRWQINCSDTSDIRIRRGKVGVWSLGEGRKRWRELEVTQ